MLSPEMLSKLHSCKNDKECIDLILQTSVDIGILIGIIKNLSHAQRETIVFQCEGLISQAMFTTVKKTEEGTLK